MCLRVLKERNKSRFDRYSPQKQCIDHIPYYLSGLSRAHFSDNLSRNSCIWNKSTFPLSPRNARYSGYNNCKTQINCSVDLTGEVHGELVFLSVINIVLSITAFWGTSLILVALRKDTSIHPPSKLLYRNLAITDLCVGIIVEPLNVAHWTSVVNKRWDICHYTLTAYRW